MTCLIGLVEDKKVYLGADSQVSWWQKSTLANPKVFKKDKYLLAACGHLRTLQILEYVFNPPAQHPNDADAKYMVANFADTLRTCFKSNGLSIVKDNIEHFCGDVLVGYKENIYLISSDYSVLMVTEPFLCTGSGVDLATGAMESLKNLPAKQRILQSLQIAGKYDLFVGPPYKVLTL